MKNKFFIIIVSLIILSYQVKPGFCLQLGDGTDKDQYSPVKIMADVKYVSAGRYHTLFIRQDNSVWATGLNNYGQLGTGDKISRSTPVKVANDAFSVSVSTIYSLVLKNNGDLYIAGKMPFTLENSTDKENTTEFRLLDDDVSYVSSSGFYSVYIKKDNSLWCVGLNEFGQCKDFKENSWIPPTKLLDNVSTAFAGVTDIKYIDCNGFAYNFTTDEKIADNVALMNNDLILKNDFSLWGKGFNYYGALGVGKNNKSVKKFMLVMDNVKTVKGNIYHTLILSNEGDVYFCGNGGNKYTKFGASGDGTNGEYFSPLKLMSNVMFIETGEFNCFAIKDDGTLWAWGLNSLNPFMEY